MDGFRTAVALKKAIAGSYPARGTVRQTKRNPAMTDDAVTLKVKEIIADRLNRKLEEITEDANLRNTLNADSLDQTEIIMALEEEFNLEIDDDANQIETVGDAIKYIKGKKGDS
jgi:acyl carrier protein